MLFLPKSKLRKHKKKRAKQCNCYRSLKSALNRRQSPYTINHGVHNLSKTETELQDTFIVSDADSEEEEISMILDVGNESTDISIDITVENAIENVLKKIDLKPATINKNFLEAVTNVENRVERISMSDDMPSVSIESFVNEESGFTNYILRVESRFNNVGETNSLSSFASNHSPKSH